MRLKNEPIWEKDGFTLRPGREGDAEAYFAQNFNPLDPEAARMTGSPTEFSRDAVVSYFLRCRDDPDRVDFLLIAPGGEIIGESVINEIDWETRRGNFRIGIFRPNFRGRGIGTWMVETTRDFAFSVLKLHRLELDVYSFNPRGRSGPTKKPVSAGRASSGMPFWTAITTLTTSSWPFWKTTGGRPVAADISCTGGR